MITHTQYGFKPGSTTVDCLVDLIEQISTCLDQGDYAVSIFLDLSKAFDTVNHFILLSKLLSYGIQKPHIDWFKSYLNKRKQRVYMPPCPLGGSGGIFPRKILKFYSHRDVFSFILKLQTMTFNNQKKRTFLNNLIMI